MKTLTYLGWQITPHIQLPDEVISSKNSLPKQHVVVPISMTHDIQYQQSAKASAAAKALIFCLTSSADSSITTSLSYNNK